MEHPRFDPAGLPRPNPSVSFWLASARNSDLLGYRSSSKLPSAADVVVIGSGMSGALTAYFLLTGLDPPRSVVVLEAREACSGATGRNGGHCRPDSYLGYPEYKRHFGKEQALKIIQNEADTLDLVNDLVEAEQIKCDFWRGKGLDVFLTQRLKAEARAALDEYVSDGGKLADVTDWIEDIEDIRRISRVRSAVGGATYPAASFYPYKFVSHLLRTCLSLGLDLQTSTPVTNVTKCASRQGLWTVHTPRGDIQTAKVVHCTNAWSSTLLPELQDWVVPLKGTCSTIVSPLSFAGQNMLKTTMIVYGRAGGSQFEYLIQRPVDGRIILGGGDPSASSSRRSMLGDTDDTTLAEVPLSVLASFMQEHFDGWREASANEGLEMAWTGIMGYTRDHIPIVGQVPGKEGQFVNVGHNGHGMARIATCARGLAKLIQGESWEATELPEAFQMTEERLKRDLNLFLSH